MTSWLIVAAALTAAAVLASAVLQTTVTSLAQEVSQSAGLSASAQPAGEPGAPGSPTAAGDPATPGQPGGLGGSQDDEDLGPLPTLESEGLTLRSSRKVVNGEDVLVLEVSDEAGDVTELPPIQLRSDNRVGDGSGGAAGDAQTATRPRDALDDYTIEDYIEDQAGHGHDLSPQSITLAEHELGVIRDTFANHDPAIRDRVLDDIRNRPGGTAPIAHIANEGAQALPQDHYQDNLLGLITDTLFGFLRNRGRKAPTQIETPFNPALGQPPGNDGPPPVDNDTDDDGVPNLIDPDYNPRPGDQDGDGVPDLIDPDTPPADPFDLTLDIPEPVNPEPVAPRPVAPRPVTPRPVTPSRSDSDYDRPDTGRGTTSNPGNPDNPAGEPDECNGSCA